jgi:sn-glycerol 3-phosphate transport system ATP-binding protein
VFLFDEPLSNLDAKLRVQMRIEIRRLHKRLKATSIFVTHDQVEAMTLADKLVVMNGGRVEQIGTPAAVYRSPASTFVAAFLGAPAMNLAEATVIAADKIALDMAPAFAITIAGQLPSVGSKLSFGIRPEDIELTTDPARGLGGRIDLVEELGGSQVAYCQVADKEFSVVLPRGSQAAEGSSMPRPASASTPNWLRARPLVWPGRLSQPNKRTVGPKRLRHSGKMPRFREFAPSHHRRVAAEA